MGARDKIREFFIANVGKVHRANQRDIIHDLRKMRQQFRVDLHTRFPMAREFPRGGEHQGSRLAGIIVFDILAGKFLIRVFFQQGFVIEQIEVARSPSRKHG